MRYRWSVLILAAFVGASASAADRGLPEGRSVHRLSISHSAADHVNYLLYVPPAYAKDASSDWPLILFLHGSEQRGDDPSLLQDLALLGFAEKSGDFPFVAVIPQCPPNVHCPPDREECPGLSGIDASYRPGPRLSHRIQHGRLRNVADGRGFSPHVRRHRPDLRHERPFRRFRA